MKNSKLTFFIFLALVLGIILGWLCPSVAVKMQPLADIFLRMIKMIIAPLIFATLVIGIAGNANVKKIGQLGVKTIIYFEIITTLALFLGLFMGNVFQPGINFNLPIENFAISEIAQFSQVEGATSLSNIFLNIFPTSIVDAMATGNILQVVVFAVFFAISLCALGEKGKPILDVLSSLSDVMFKFTEFVMFFAPFGVFGAITSIIGKNGIGILVHYAKLIGVLYLSLIIFVVFVLFVVCRLVKVPFLGLLNTIKEPALLAFSTASSEAAFPKAMEKIENFGVSKNIVGFVMPTGYTFNLDGSTLYLSLAVLFCVQIVGIELPIGQQILIMLSLMLTSKGIAAVPRVSLVVLTATLVSFNYPIIGVAVLLGIDQLLDMGRTTVNLIGNCVACVFVACWEKEFDYDKMKNYLSTKS